MNTDKKRLSISFAEEDYQWLNERAELTGNSRAAVLRQIVRGLRLENPSLLTFGSRRLVFADESEAAGENSRAQKRTDKQPDETDKSGIEAFRNR